MAQYEQSRPAGTVHDKQEQDFAARIDRLHGRVSAQDILIATLEKEIRRLKEKMDRHADHLNRQGRG